MTPDSQPFVLIVDDCDSTRESLMVAFEAKGLHCKGVVDGETALELVTEGLCPTSALVAYHLAQATGAETTRGLKSICPNIQIIATSTEHSRRDEMIEAGAVEFLGKPFDLNLLFRHVTMEFDQDAH